LSNTSSLMSTLTSLPGISQAVQAMAAVPAAKYRAVVLVLCIVYLLSLAADIVWKAVPSPESKPLAFENKAGSSRSNSQSSAQATQTYVDIKSMQSWQLFGNAIETPEPVAAIVQDDVDLDAKETRLSLKLMGVMQSDNPNRGHAIIEHQNKSELYAVGDPIPVSRGVSLSKVLIDRVIIDNNGSFESLFLWDEESQSVKRPTTKSTTSTKQNTQAKKTRKLDYRNNRELTSIAAGYKKKLLSDPMSLTNVIRFSPAKDGNGESIGFRISPGKDRQQFKAFGLKSGDVVQAVNGVSLTDPANAMQVYQDMQSASEASFDILRGSENISLIVNLEE